MVKNRKEKEINKIVKEVIVQYMQKDKLMRMEMYLDSLITAISLVFVLTFFGLNFISGIIAGILIGLIIFLTNKLIEKDYKTREDRVNKKLKELGYKNGE